MISLEIPGYGSLELEHLVLDYNGTLARDGVLLPGVAESLQKLARELAVHVVTADTFGSVAQQLLGLDLQIEILRSGDHTAEKRALVERLGSSRCAAVGNGNNDRAMLSAAALGIVVSGSEGCSIQTLGEADLLCLSIDEALGLLAHPKRLVATLRR